MLLENPLWGVPRIQSELAMLGHTVSEATVRKYRIRKRNPPSQTWRTFLVNHLTEIVAIDFFTVPTATFRVLFAFVVMRHDRRYVVRFPASQRTARKGGLVVTCRPENDENVRPDYPDMSVCLTSKTLRRYHLQQLSARRAQIVHEHLETCDACRTLLTEISSRLIDDARARAEHGDETVLAVRDNRANKPSHASSNKGVQETKPGSIDGKRIIEEYQPEVPDFDLERRLGTGTFGEVWLARSRTGIYRAITLIRRGCLSEVEFDSLRTLQIHARGHPNLIDILHVGETEDHFYYIMELADGYTALPTFSAADYQPRTLLPDVKRNRPFPTDRACEVVLEILQGLGHLHQHELLHRDVKPGNVVFVDGRAT